MTFDRVAVVETALDNLLRQATAAPARLAPTDPLQPGSTLTATRALALYEDQLVSRQLDVAARELKKTNRSFYTIGSAGHENNVVLGALLRITDPAFLHYRSGAFMMARARQLPGSTPALDTLLGVVASRDDPIAQGRHKVWGSRALWVPPQTSTIASHLPKAMGLAFSLARARRLGVSDELPNDAVVVCSFGDASANHATALSAINTARYAERIGLPMPILFVCEDNGAGISVSTPEGWIADSFGSLPHLRYREADGEIDQVWQAAADAIRYVRGARKPAFLHLRDGTHLGPRRQRRGARLPLARRDRFDRIARPTAPQRGTPDRERCGHPTRAAGSRGRDPAADRGGGGGGNPSSSVGDHRRRGGAARPVPRRACSTSRRGSPGRP